MSSVNKNQQFFLYAYTKCNCRSFTLFKNMPIQLSEQRTFNSTTSIIPPSRFTAFCICSGYSVQLTEKLILIQSGKYNYVVIEM